MLNGRATHYTIGTSGRLRRFIRVAIYFCLIAILIGFFALAGTWDFQDYVERKRSEKQGTSFGTD